MKITKEKKMEVLIDSYNLLKKDFRDNRLDLADIVVKLYESDKNTGIKMFKQAVEDAKKSDGASLCGDFLLSFIGKADGKIEQSVLDELIWNQPIMRRYLYEYGWWISSEQPTDWIRKKINANELELVDETLTIAYRNPSGKDTWDMLMSNIMPTSVTDEGYVLLEKWCKKVTNETDRAKLNLKLLQYLEETE